MMKRYLVIGLGLALSAGSLSVLAAKSGDPLPAGQYTASTLPQGVPTCASIAKGNIFPSASNMVSGDSDGAVKCALKFGEQYDFGLSLPPQKVASCVLSAGQIEYYAYRYDDNTGYPDQVGKTVYVNGGTQFTVPIFSRDNPPPVDSSNFYYFNVADNYDHNAPNNDPIYIILQCQPVSQGALHHLDNTRGMK